jgi:hypothetical protein
MTNRQLNTSAVVLFLLCMILLLANFYGWAAEMIGAIKYPFQLDYGEGIVWQQADMILRGEDYRPLSDNSFIVFHYPPVYHLVSALLAKTLNFNWLVAGRTVSVLSTLGAAFVIGALTVSSRSVPRVNSDESDMCALVAGLVVFTLVPVAYWSPLARVDMISVLLTLAGVWFGLRSIEHPGNVFLAAVFFVLALFARQTAISAPLATFVVLVCLRPAMAWRGVLLGSGLGLACFAAMTIGTSGEFIKHIITYNANSVTFGNVEMMSYFLVLHSILFVLVYLSIARFVRELFSHAADSNVISALRKLGASDWLGTVRLFSVVWFCLASLTSLSVIKSGSNVNYLLEWTLSWSLLVGLALREPVRNVVGILNRGSSGTNLSLSAVIVFAALALQVAGLPTALAVQIPNLPAAPLGKRFAEKEERDNLQELLRKMRGVPGLIIPDDMVAVKMAGKEVIWERAIFRELTARGQWDEKPFLELVKQKRFGLIVTESGPQDSVFKARYSSSIVQAF